MFAIFAELYFHPNSMVYKGGWKVRLIPPLYFLFLFSLLLSSPTIPPDPPPPHAFYATFLLTESIPLDRFGIFCVQTFWNVIFLPVFILQASDADVNPVGSASFALFSPYPAHISCPNRHYCVIKRNNFFHWKAASSGSELGSASKYIVSDSLVTCVCVMLCVCVCVIVPKKVYNTLSLSFWLTIGGF